MDGLLTILQSVSKLDHLQLPKLIQAIDDHQSFNQKVKNIHSLEIFINIDVVVCYLFSTHTHT